MDFNDINSLREEGFNGFKTVVELWHDMKPTPKKIGIYLVLNPEEAPEFINPGVGGFFNGRDPNVSIEELKDKYILSVMVIYIGKAGNPSGEATLYSRLGQYLRFGQGKNVGHWGGRYIWQLKRHSNLIICWKPTPDLDPRHIEKSLISDFSLQFGRMPFANLAR